MCASDDGALGKSVVGPALESLEPSSTGLPLSVAESLVGGTMLTGASSTSPSMLSDGARASGLLAVESELVLRLGSMPP